MESFNASRAKACDMRVIPTNICGKKCGTCKYFNAAKNGYCSHPKVKMNVDSYWSCKYWDNPQSRPVTSPDQLDEISAARLSRSLKIARFTLSHWGRYRFELSDRRREALLEMAKRGGSPGEREQAVRALKNHGIDCGHDEHGKFTWNNTCKAGKTKEKSKESGQTEQKGAFSKEFSEFIDDVNLIAKASDKEIDDLVIREMNHLSIGKLREYVKKTQYASIFETYPKISKNNLIKAIRDNLYIRKSTYNRNRFSRVSRELSRLSRSERVSLIKEIVSRFSDCGHKPNGDFDYKNTCASLRRDIRAAEKSGMLHNMAKDFRAKGERRLGHIEAELETADEARAKELEAERTEIEAVLHHMDRKTNSMFNATENLKEANHYLTEVASKSPHSVDGKRLIAIKSSVRKIYSGIKNIDNLDKDQVKSLKNEAILASSVCSYLASRSENENIQKSAKLLKHTLKLIGEKTGEKIRFSNSSRFAKMGSAGDCGHAKDITEEGRVGFAPGNKCKVCGKTGCKGHGKTSKAIKAPKTSRGGFRVTQDDLPVSLRGRLSEKDLSFIKSKETLHDMIVLYENSRKGLEHGTLPTVKELMIAAKIGESTRGQYEWTGNMMMEVSNEISSALGKQLGPKYANIWAALNSVLSTRAEYREHTIGAMRLMRMWIEAGEPTDKDSIESIMEDFAKQKEKSRKTGKEVQLYRGLYDPKGNKTFPGKWNGVQRVLQNPNNPDFYKSIVAGKNIAKTQEFFSSWFEPVSFAYDKWMSRLTKPDMPKTSPAKMLAKLKSYIAARSTNKRLSKSESKAYNDLTLLQENLISRTSVYLSYKAAASEAARTLSEETGVKWQTREVQEAVWSAAIGIACLKAYGMSNEDIPDNLAHEMINQSWDIQSLIKEGGLKNELARLGVTERTLESLSSWEKFSKEKQPQKQGKIDISDREAVKNLAERIPPAGISTKNEKRVLIPDKETGKAKEVKRWGSSRPKSRMEKMGSSADCGHAPDMTEEGRVGFAPGNKCKVCGKSGCKKHSKSYAFYSPNTNEGTGFDYARKALYSDAQAAARRVSEEIDSKNGFKSKDYDAIGDWADGAENSIVSEYNDVEDFDTLKYLASLKGKAWKQKAVLPFMVDEDGPDMLHILSIADNDLRSIRKNLGEAGIDFRTLIPRGKKTAVMIYDEGGKLIENLERLEKAYPGRIHGETHRGKGEFVGSFNSRTEGRREYERAIGSYKEKHASTRLHKRQDKRTAWPKLDTGGRACTCQGKRRGEPCQCKGFQKGNKAGAIKKQRRMDKTAAADTIKAAAKKNRMLTNRVRKSYSGVNVEEY